MDQHWIITDLKEHGYSGIDERSKVHHLLAGIKTDNLDDVKALIITSKPLCSNFFACVTLYKDFISVCYAESGFDVILEQPLSY